MHIHIYIYIYIRIYIYIYPRLPKAIKRIVEVARLFFAERPFFAPGPEYPRNHGVCCPRIA